MLRAPVRVPTEATGAAVTVASVEPKHDLDERVNAEGDPEAFIAALLQIDPDQDPNATED